METNEQLMAIADKSLQSVFKNEELVYNAGKNIFLVQGYTSFAGNTYYQGVRFSDRIIISQHIGQGYLYTFLNGIQIFGFNGKEAKLIIEKNYHCCIYSESIVKTESENLVKEFLRKQAAITGSIVEENQLEIFSRQLVADTMRNQLSLNQANS
jgi:hypothetical protein